HPARRRVVFGTATRHWRPDGRPDPRDHGAPLHLRDHARRIRHRAADAERVGLWAREHPEAGKLVEMPLPCGAKPRLILLHLCSEAVRTKSTQIQIGESIRYFLQKMNIAGQGSEYRSVKEQMECLAACRMIFGMSTP